MAYVKERQRDMEETTCRVQVIGVFVGRTQVQCMLYELYNKRELLPQAIRLNKLYMQLEWFCE